MQRMNGMKELVNRVNRYPTTPRRCVESRYLNEESRISSSDFIDPFLPPRYHLVFSLLVFMLLFLFLSFSSYIYVRTYERTYSSPDFYLYLCIFHRHFS